MAFPDDFKGYERAIQQGAKVPWITEDAVRGFWDKRVPVKDAIEALKKHKSPPSHTVFAAKSWEQVWGPTVKLAEEDGGAVEKAKKHGEWNLVVRKMSASRWGYFMENPQGGGGGSNSYPSLKAAQSAALRGTDFKGATRVWLIIAEWDASAGQDGDYKVKKSEWLPVTEGKQAAGKKPGKPQLIEVGDVKIRSAYYKVSDGLYGLEDAVNETEATKHDAALKAAVKEVQTAFDKVDKALKPYAWD